VRKLIKQAQDSAPASIAACEPCGDTGWRFIERDGRRGNVECDCRRERRIKAALARVERRFWVNGQPPRLAALQPRADLVSDKSRAAFIAERQAAAIGQMRREPLASYFFAGPRDAGKTHLAYALYVHAVENTNRRVWAGTVADLLNQYQKMQGSEPGADGKPFVAEVLPENLRGYEWTILLDEVAYVRPTAFRHEKFFDLIDAIWKNSHQLLCTSNLTLDALSAKWDAISGGNGEAIIKRLTADAYRVGFF
jgi:DNA replication protein DnaC